MRAIVLSNLENTAPISAAMRALAKDGHDGPVKQKAQKRGTKLRRAPEVTVVPPAVSTDDLPSSPTLPLSPT